MFQPFEVFIHHKTIEIQEKSFLLGELSADILSISIPDFHDMYALRTTLMDLLESDKDSPEIPEVLSQLHAHFSKRTLLQMVLIDLDYINYTWKKDRALALSYVEKSIQMVNDIYAFNQTVFRFIDRYLMALKKLDSENYAAALYDFFFSEHADKRVVNPLRNGEHNFNMFDSMKVAYVPREVPNKKDIYSLYEYYELETLQAFLKLDFIGALRIGHQVRRCEHCRKFFLVTAGYHTLYCTKPLPENPRLTCRHVGAKKKEKEKAKNTPEIQEYKKALDRIYTDVFRENITEEEGECAKKQARQLKDQALVYPERAQSLGTALQSDSLYALCGIVRK